MKLDRNENTSGRGKYALLNLRKDTIEWGCTGEQDEFFVIKLKDKHARTALLAYSKSIETEDEEFSIEVAQLAARAGPLSKFCKAPD